MTRCVGAGRQVEPTHYHGSTYDSKARYACYWHQIDAVMRRNPRRVLEVGIGNGFVSRALRANGIDVETLDFDPQLLPRVAGSASALPFATGAFDLVLCCQVLEHLPIEQAMAALHEFGRVSTGSIVISVPDVTPRVRLLIPVPGRRELELVVRNPFRSRRTSVSEPRQHRWELGTRQLPPAMFRQVLGRTGLQINREYCVFEQPYYHFFELEP